MTETVKVTRTGEKKSKISMTTLRCVIVLVVIGVVCVLILAVANRFLQPEIKLDRETSDLINALAPTGESNEDAYKNNRIKMVDLAKGSFAFKSIDDYNSKHGSATQKVRALYTSQDTSGKVTYVVEAQGKGYVDAIVMLIAYDGDKVSAVTVKSQSESYWDSAHIPSEKELYDAFVGTSGKVESSTIIATSGVTLKGTTGGMASAVSIANDFIARLGVTSTAQTANATRKGGKLWM